MKSSSKIILSLGGSLIFPDSIDISFVKRFKELIKKEVENGKKFIIITGGGKICRVYNAAIEEIRNVSNTELDWLGIATTKMNAEFLKTAFGDFACDTVMTNPTDIPNTNKPVIIGCGWKPGCSSDMDAVLSAKASGAKTIINLSNISHVYNSDPKINPDAKPLTELSWKEYRNIIPKEWKSGMNTPFDPEASRVAEENNIEVIIMNGDLLNFQNYLNGQSFEGTTIR